LVAGERQLVAAAGAGAVDRGDEFQPACLARVLDAVPRLVGELAEVHLERMTRGSEHVDVGAGAEHAALAARNDHAFHFRMLEADAVQRIVQLDVDTEVIAVELQPVAGREALVLRDVERKGCHRALVRELPMVVAVGTGFEVDHATAFFSSASAWRTLLPEVSTTVPARP